MIEGPDAEHWRREPIGVLASGGVDSAVLLAELAESAPAVWPIHIRFGLVWEPAEEQGLRRFIEELGSPHLKPLVAFSLPIGDVYGPHWSTTGENIPDETSPDEAVFLPGRNLLLLAQPSLWCHRMGISTIALGPLAGNPFADSSDRFFAGLQDLVNLAVGGNLRIVTPYKTLHKIDVLRRGIDYPLHETFSCIRPQGTLHCGRCNKCAERQRGFAQAQIRDRTLYANAPAR